MKKILGISGLLVAICLFTAANNPDFLNGYNIQNTVRWTALYGVLSIGAAFVIITGGIDLSIGSVVGLSGSLLAWLMTVQGWNPVLAVATCIGLSLLIGVAHGLLITRLGLQPFVVTLCGLLLYRGCARYVTDDQSIGFGTGNELLRTLATGGIQITDSFRLPAPFIIMVVIAVVASIVLNRTIYGRYLFALGRNEEAARYSGINTRRVQMSAYVVCSGLAGFGGVLFSLDVNSVQPVSFGEFYELYAIAAAVLGGCSLRGGEGSVLGVIIGAAVMRVLYNAINILGIPTHLEYAVIGAVILAGVIIDESARRVVAQRRARARAA
jgi:ribose transport system permease protein